ncbi:hypothetical protein BDA96_10G241600 [Sorghum bicolor]|uniref:Uncharacterized protein n=1 Tax=Sorghum bicolor TaxID=4558 RepID=A0A921U1C3_SORBI|nr:hypothetical protein BDA96_10G241600 [Sorghum bicolor]
MANRSSPEEMTSAGLPSPRFTASVHLISAVPERCLPLLSPVRQLLEPLRRHDRRSPTMAARAMAATSGGGARSSSATLASRAGRVRHHVPDVAVRHAIPRLHLLSPCRRST